VDENVSRDLQDYITYRFGKLSKLSSSITANRPQSSDSNLLSNLKLHLKQISAGCLLFLKLTIDLIELGHLVIKSSSFKVCVTSFLVSLIFHFTKYTINVCGLTLRLKVFPVSLSEVFMLHCNLRFPTQTAFGFVLPILSVCLATLNPLNLLEIYHSVNSLQAKENLPWVEFLRIFKVNCCEHMQSIFQSKRMWISI
jgi:hypothetical protein